MKDTDHSAQILSPTLYEYFGRSEEIDEDLLTFLNGLIQKEYKRALGPAFSDEDKAKVAGPAQAAIEALNMIRKRLEAQVVVNGKTDLQLLGKLLTIKNPEVSNAVIDTTNSLIYWIGNHCINRPYLTHRYHKMPQIYFPSDMAVVNKNIFHVSCVLFCRCTRKSYARSFQQLSRLWPLTHF